MRLTYGDLLAELKGGARVALMIRHAERPHIDRTDPTFGETLALTPAGQAAAFDLGTLLAPMSGDVEFHSSPMNRTRETARQLALSRVSLSPRKNASAALKKVLPSIPSLRSTAVMR